MIKTIVRIEFSAYKIVRIDCSMRTQSGIAQDEKHKLLHRNFIYYRTVPYGKCSTCHTHQVNDDIIYLMSVASSTLAIRNSPEVNKISMK